MVTNDCNKLNGIEMLAGQQQQKQRNNHHKEEEEVTGRRRWRRTTTTTAAAITVCCNRKSIAMATQSKANRTKNTLLTSLFISILTILKLTQLTSAAMNLPDGIENILGFVPKSTFQCERDGYFGDIENDCKLFHLCQRQVTSNGRTEWRHWTYACGNQTMFNQLTLTCAFVDEAIPCKHASQFQYLNEVIHKPAEPFLTDADVTSGISYYSNRIMSDGARARAFEDSQLLAQIGGGDQGLSSNNNQFQASSSSFSANNNFEPAPRQSFPANVDSESTDSGNSINQVAPLTNNNNNNFVGTSFSFTPNENFQQQSAFDSRQQQQQPVARFATGPSHATRLQAAQLPNTNQAGGLIENHSIQLDHSSSNTNPAPTQLVNPQQAAPSAIWSLPPPAPAPTATNFKQQRVTIRINSNSNRLPRNRNLQPTFSQASSPRVAVVPTTTTTAAAVEPVNTGFGQTFSSSPSSSQFNQPQNQFFNFPTATTTTAANNNNNNFLETTTFATTAQPPQLTSTIAAAQPTTLASNNTAQSFSFSLATNHQLGSQAETTFIANRQEPATGTENHHQFGPLQSIQVVSESPLSLQQQQQPLQPVTASLFSSSAAPPPPPSTTTTLASSPVSLVGNTSPQPQFVFNSNEVTTTTTSQTPAFTTTFQSLPTLPATTVATDSVAATTPAAGLQLRRRQDQQLPRFRGNELTNFAGAHAGFQSTRLSANRQQRSSPSAAAAPTPLVMRRQPTATTTAASSNSSQAGGINLSRQQQQQESLVGPQDWSSNDFWKRPFADVTQLLAPSKFDSFLTRRRV